MLWSPHNITETLSLKHNNPHFRLLYHSTFDCYKYLIFYVYFHGYLYVNVRTNELSRLTFRMQNIGLGHNLIVSSFVVTDDVNVNQSGV